MDTDATDKRSALDEEFAKGQAVYAYFNQSKMWQPNGRPLIAITDMEEAWRHNAARWLERRATWFEVHYTFGELNGLSKPTWQPVAITLGGEMVDDGPLVSELDSMGEHASEAFDSMLEQRGADPVAWIRTTPLYRALVAGLPVGEARQELADRARHWSDCPSRADATATCECWKHHLSECAIRNGNPELGCTCCDMSPEWTI